MCIDFLSAVDVESQSLFGDSEDVEMEGGGRVTTTETTLWVDKYAPRHYTHLLSDDVSTRVYTCTWVAHQRLVQCMSKGEE